MRWKYIYLIFGLLWCYIPDVFSDEEVMAQEDSYIKKFREDKAKISEMLFNKQDSFYLTNKNSYLMGQEIEKFKTHLRDNYGLKDFIHFLKPEYQDYFKNRRYNVDVEKYNAIKKETVTNDTMRFLFKKLFDDGDKDDTLQDSLYYDLGQSNSDLRLFDENGGVVECLLGEENKDNVVLKYLLSQAIMNATNKPNDDRYELLNALMQEGSFEDIYKIFLDLTQDVSLFNLFENGDMFNKFGLQSDIFSSVFPSMNSDEFSANVELYFDEEEMKWITQKIVFTNDGIKNKKTPGYTYTDINVNYDNYNPLMVIGKFIGNKFFIKLLEKYFLKHLFPVLLVLLFTTAYQYIVLSILYFISMFPKLKYLGEVFTIDPSVLSVVIILFCYMLGRFYLLPLVWKILKFVCNIILYIAWYPVRFCIVEPVNYILRSTLNCSLNNMLSNIFVACIYFVILILLLYRDILIDTEEISTLFTECVKAIFEEYKIHPATMCEELNGSYIKIKEKSPYLTEFLSFLSFDGVFSSSNYKLCDTFFKENLIHEKPKNLNKNDFNMFHKFGFLLLKCSKKFLFNVIKPEWIFYICNFFRLLSIIAIIGVFLDLALADFNCNIFRSSPDSYYDDLFHDVVTVSLLGCMHKKKCSIENFMNCIKSFFAKCEGSDVLRRLSSENLQYKNNFMTTLDLWHKIEYGQIKYNYSEDVIGSTDIALGNMFRYLNKCNSFNIVENIYEKYTMSEILTFLNDYIMFFYYFMHSYKFFQSAIKDIYKFGIYFYPVYLSKHKGFCIANFKQVGENGNLSLEVKDSKNIFLGEQCVPNDIVFNDNCQNIIFNGTNGAGKTIFLSQAALNVILAQSLGIAYAKSYKGDIIDKIVTSFSVDITIDIFKSKLMQEYSNMDKIYTYTIKNKNKRILFVLDEICSGTDPESGDKIVKEFLVKLMQLGGNVIAATHYNSPREIENINWLRCRNYTFSIHRGADGEVIYDHIVKKGVPEFSFALAVMKTMLINKQINKDFYNIFVK